MRRMNRVIISGLWIALCTAAACLSGGYAGFGNTDSGGIRYGGGICYRESGNVSCPVAVSHAFTLYQFGQ